MAQTDTQAAGDMGGRSLSAPAWICLLTAVTVLTMATQLRFPFAGGRIGFSDLLLGVSFVAILWDQLKRGTTYRYPAALITALTLYLVAGIIGRGGRGAAVESVQRFEQLFCGVLLFLFILRERRSWIVPLLTACVGLNVIMAGVQVLRFGYGSVLPPADVLALPWGIGGAYGGLFRDRVALSLFLGIALVLLNGSWLAWTASQRRREGLVVVGTAGALACVAYGPVLVLAALGLLLTGLLSGRRAAALNAAAIMLCVLILRFSGVGAVVRESLSPFKAGEGEIKTCYSDAVAAMRMAGRRPLTGVGAGNYQQYIGTCYGELPKPNYNDIETDTQSGLGILLGTVGYPAGLAMILVFLVAGTGALRRYASGSAPQPLLLGAGVAAGVSACSMLVTDPFVRGPVWLLALTFAVAFGTDDETPPAGIRLNWFKTIACGVLYAGGAALVFIIPAADALTNTPSVRSVRSAARRPVGATTAQLPQTSGGISDLFRVIDASDAVTLTPPFERASDSQAAKQSVLRIPDEKGKPPEGEEPDMKYGGAVYDLDIQDAATCKVWLRVWWEGACGNTIYVKMDDGKAVTVGNDGTYDAWHWLEAPITYPLTQGPHKLVLLNREDGIRVDQILLTDDMEYFPQGIEEE